MLMNALLILHLSDMILGSAVTRGDRHALQLMVLFFLCHEGIVPYLPWAAKVALNRYSTSRVPHVLS